jgi:hypothetical protein
MIFILTPKLYNKELLLKLFTVFIKIMNILKKLIYPEKNLLMKISRDLPIIIKINLKKIKFEIY